MKEKNMLTLVNEDGNIYEYEILLIFYLNQTEKNYVVYTDNTYDNGSLNVYAAIFYPNDDTKLESVRTNYEWNEINKRLEDLKMESVKFEEEE